MHAGILLPRTTYEMLDSPLLVQISRSQAKRGDLAFFGPGHVEMVDNPEHLVRRRYLRRPDRVDGIDLLLAAHGLLPY